VSLATKRVARGCGWRDEFVHEYYNDIGDEKTAKYEWNLCASKGGVR
jgi:hypothetical protein